MPYSTIAVLGAFVVGCLLLTPAQAPAQPPAKVPLILDTDLGSDIGDAFALALVLASPELDLRGVTTVSGDTQVRALMACRFLTMTGRRHTPVAAGTPPQPPGQISPSGQYRYYYHPDVLFNRTTRPQKEGAVPFLYSRLKGEPGKITLVAAGPLTNIARLLSEKPEARSWIKRIVLNAGALPTDSKAAQAVFASGIPLTVIAADATLGIDLNQEELGRVFAPGTPLTLQVQTLYQLWDQQGPVLTDALAVALCLDERFCKVEEQCLEVDDRGIVRAGTGKSNARVAASVRGKEFRKWYVERLESCLPPSRRPAKLAPPEGMPHRVHVAEDYQNDIERFWWMSGKAETKNVPPGSDRVCRGVLTHDFDDLLGNPKAMYTAVIFNPVPGPPMGKKTRLCFSFWLKGTDTLRVQIYSLTNGYHRHLVLTGLAQSQWQSGSVDMTVARRPDGTGGPLSENERIDDIQFYADPTAELLIGNMVLYDAALPGEKRPFPRHVHFAAGFDTGQQGKLWPGNFDIVPEKGFFWRAARSVPNPDLALPWIRLHLRGERTLDALTHVSFRYHLTDAASIRVVMVNRTAKVNHVIELKDLAKGQWSQATVDFNSSKRVDGNPGQPRKGDRVDEIQFLLPQGAELLLDDFIMFEPGRSQR